MRAPALQSAAKSLSATVEDIELERAFEKADADGGASLSSLPPATRWRLPFAMAFYSPGESCG